MRFVPRIIELSKREQVQRAMQAIGCDVRGIAIMQDKILFKVMKIEGIEAKNANLLKQTFLAKGGEVAVARGVADLSVTHTDVIICATLKQYRLAIAQLKQQPWGLPDIAMAMEETLYNSEAKMKREYTWKDKQLVLPTKRTLVMGILNVTPDSFSDGGRFKNMDNALRHMQEMCGSGADIIDIGAESTRPYGENQAIDAQEEMERLMPTLERLVKECPIPISVDTYKAEVAEAALASGAHMINDVWGLQRDANMVKVIARHKVPVIVMHNRQGINLESDIMQDILNFFSKSIEIAEAHGILREQLILDPGIGFAKTTEQNLSVLARLRELKGLGCPILIGTSRKRFIGEVLDLPVEDRVEGTAATVACAIMNGAKIIRVHDVKEMVRIARMTDAITKEEF
ncbi:dihydropteroate synthase [Azotosporobacter soli]|uniref:dihydropteroate synthase n=1 Tax=Azotosporobacter soli TaxID=3055040 RepID=UPI0031FE7B00